MSDHAAVMPQPAVISDPDADLRWREWQARGAASDRRSAANMRAVALLVAAALLGWFVVQLL